MRSFLDGELTISPRSGYVRVWHRRSARDLAELEPVLKAMEAALLENGTTCLLFDSREANYQEGEVQARMWSWLQGCDLVKRVATLVESPMLAISVNMTGMTKGVSIKAFADEREAEVWLTR